MMQPSDPSVRPPVVAGRFYPADALHCRGEAQGYLKPDADASAKRWMGALVPHAGWICSGAIAGQAIATLAAQAPADVVVVFGAIHTPLPTQLAALDNHQRWAVPTGFSQVSANVQQQLQQQGNLFMVDPRLHATEHAVEVNVPMIQLAWPNTPILPIEVPALEVAEQIGQRTAQLVAEAGLRAVYIASSDLTHYGLNYRFTPVGIGPAAMEWTKENDRRLLKLITSLASDQIVPEVRQHHSACGAGAISALLAACKQSGATEARILRHATSYETLAPVVPQPPNNAVGYAAVVVG